jgi:hypothetical protein
VRSRDRRHRKLLVDEREPTAATATSTAKASKTSKTPNTSKHTGLVETSYKPGDCVTWTDGADETDTHVVGCRAAHWIQITGPVNVDKTVTTEPTDAKWQELLSSLCPATVNHFLGRQVDPSQYGFYALGALFPSHESWGTGDRTMWCGVVSTGPNVKGGFPPFTGDIKSPWAGGYAICRPGYPDQQWRIRRSSQKRQCRSCRRCTRLPFV